MANKHPQEARSSFEVKGRRDDIEIPLIGFYERKLTSCFMSSAWSAELISLLTLLTGGVGATWALFCAVDDDGRTLRRYFRISGCSIRAAAAVVVPPPPAAAAATFKRLCKAAGGTVAVVTVADAGVVLNARWQTNKKIKPSN